MSLNRSMYDHFVHNTHAHFVKRRWLIQYVTAYPEILQQPVQNSKNLAALGSKNISSNANPQHSQPIGYVVYKLTLLIEHNSA